MERPKPTKKLLTELCGNDPKLISSVHHGLYENPLKEIYPWINLDDLIVFSAASFTFRKQKPREFEEMVLSSSMYDIFHEVYNSTSNPGGMKGFVWLYTNRDILQTNDTYLQLNPFTKKDLKIRLEKVGIDATKRLKENLIKPTKQYVFECDYYLVKHQLGDNSRLVVMNFQPYYPKKGVIEKRYAKEIERMLSRYPTEYSLDYERQLYLLR